MVEGDVYWEFGLEVPVEGVGQRDPDDRVAVHAAQDEQG